LVDGWHVILWKVGKSGKGAEPTGDEASGKHYFALYVETRISEGKPPKNRGVRCLAGLAGAAVSDEWDGQESRPLPPLSRVKSKKLRKSYSHHMG
jgi:hypothetical protein